jgi:hypothetical protein
VHLSFILLYSSLLTPRIAHFVRSFYFSIFFQFFSVSLRSTSPSWILADPRHSSFLGLVNTLIHSGDFILSGFSLGYSYRYDIYIYHINLFILLSGFSRRASLSTLFLLADFLRHSSFLRGSSTSISDLWLPPSCSRVPSYRSARLISLGLSPFDLVFFLFILSPSPRGFRRSEVASQAPRFFHFTFTPWGFAP